MKKHTLFPSTPISFPIQTCIFQLLPFGETKIYTDIPGVLTSEFSAVTPFLTQKRTEKEEALFTKHEIHVKALTSYKEDVIVTHGR